MNSVFISWTNIQDFLNKHFALLSPLEEDMKVFLICSLIQYVCLLCVLYLCNSTITTTVLHSPQHTKCGFVILDRVLGQGKSEATLEIQES